MDQPPAIVLNSSDWMAHSVDSKRNDFCRRAMNVLKKLKIADGKNFCVRLVCISKLGLNIQ